MPSVVEGGWAWLKQRLGADRPAWLGSEVALVAGASSGIGAATARALGARGAMVILASRRAARLEEQANAILRAGGRAVAIPTDITDARQIAELTHRAVGLFGHVDILVNSAGVGMPGPVPRLTIEAIRAQVETNLIGPILLTRALLPGMIARRHGVIISIASLAGHVPMDPLYSATKFGLRGFSLALSRQLRGTGVTASMVSPGFIRTAMTGEMRGRLPGPGYVAEQVLALIASPRRQVIVPPHYQLDVWGERMLPWLMERLLRRRMGEEDGPASSLTDMSDVRRISTAAPAGIESPTAADEPGALDASTGDEPMVR